jgi:peptide/nickel transport system permease protein
VIGQNPVTGLAFGLFLLIAVCAIFGPLVAPYDPLASNTEAAYQAPSAAHWFGTDQLGRDIMSRVMAATRLDLAIAASCIYSYAHEGDASPRRRLA